MGFLKDGWGSAMQREYLDIVQERRDCKVQTCFVQPLIARLDFNETSTISAKTHYPGQGSIRSVTTRVMVITEMDRWTLEAFTTLISFFFFSP